MKTTITAVLALALLAAYAGAEQGGHEKQRGGRGASQAPNPGGQEKVRVASNPVHVRPAAPQRPSVVTHMQRYHMPQPNAIKNPSHIVHDNGRAAWPGKDDHGTRIQQPAARIPPRHHAEIVRNEAFVRNIQARERAEMTPRKYFWHDEGGRRYAHYYDRGTHWYGFYHGPTFYWTRYYSNRWWWYDGRQARWVYWWNGFWWWPGPLGVTYVYVDNSYYPYNEGEVVVAHPEVVTPPAAAPAAAGGSVWNSPDGRRMVQISGAQSEAFLYDKSAGDPVYMRYLGPNVAKVRFTGGADGKPLQILLDYKDGTFALFDAEGESSQTPPASTLDLPGPPPAVEPPPADAEPPPLPPQGQAQ